MSYILCAAIVLSSSLSLAKSKTPGKGDADFAQREYMQEISRQIGVTCTHCHDLKDFKKASLPAYQVGKTHIEIVRMLNEKHPGKIAQKVDCYMCHRGKAVPDYKEKFLIEPKRATN